MVDFQNNSYNFISDNNSNNSSVNQNNTNIPVVDNQNSNKNINLNNNNGISQTSYVSNISSVGIPPQPVNQTYDVLNPDFSEKLNSEINSQLNNYEIDNTSSRSLPNQNINAFNFASDGEVSSRTSNNPSIFSGFAKLALLILIPIAIIAGTGIYFINRNKELAYQKEKNVLVVVPMQDSNWQDIGTVFEPLITIPIKTQNGYEKWEFLIDSGAVISSLPREWAEKTGQNLAFLKRSTFRGFGGMTSTAYQGDMTILLGEEEYHLPVVFTEAGGTKSLIGRKGFFQDYSLYFNHMEKSIEIRK